MRRFLNNISILTITALCMLWLSSCRDDTFSFYDDDSDFTTVTFTLAPEAAAFSTRSEGNPMQNFNSGHIGDGSKVDMLVYAVYDKDGNLIEEYSDGMDPDLKDKVEDEGEGQTVKKIDRFPCSVNLVLKKGVEYRIAFWAQSSHTRAYDTSDLKKVEVRYSEIASEMEDGAASPEKETTTGDISEESNLATFSGTTPNNDEFRDAFCRTVTVKTTNTKMQQNVYLYRPLSQINVGTSGYDYEIVTRDAKVKYTHSKIRVNRLARYLDVINDVTITSTTTDGDDSDNRTQEAFAVADFEWSPIPAYVNYRQKNDDGSYNNSTKLPAYPSYTKWDWIYGGQSNGWVRPGDGVDEKNPIHPDMKYEEHAHEEFLQVHLYDTATKNPDQFDNSFTGDNFHLSGEPYSEGEKREGYMDYANLTDKNDKKSETFKWLSMCYVLTSSSKEEPRVINNVKVWLASDENGTNEYQILDLNYVPVQRNWRTNIVGELLTSENTFQVKLDQNFGGEYDAWRKENDSWEWSGPLYSGVYYDAEKDEILISSVQGLLWFQRMVNGEMKVREDYSPVKYKDYVIENREVEQLKKGDLYPYYTSDGKTRELPSNPIPEPADEATKKRILMATHQLYRKDGDNGWPENGQFHFTGHAENMPDGMKEQATVKLMADLDLSGIEWLPIGLDYKMHDQMHRKLLETNPENRGFFGIFDGNGHTIANLTTKRFSATVHSTTQQDANTKTYGPFDNLQWFGRGLFGAIGGNAEIKNLTMLNVDIMGSQGVGGIVGIAFGDAIKIKNCTVDGGRIESTPMYRGDSRENGRYRTFARSVYTGGIVGYFHTQNGEVENCEVRNVYITGLRRMGGLIGSFGQEYLEPNYVDTDSSPNSGVYPGYDNFEESHPKSVSNNKLTNTTIVATSYTSYGMKAYLTNSRENSMTGFGYGVGTYKPYANKLIGGYQGEMPELMNTQGERTKIENNSTVSSVYTVYSIEVQTKNGADVRVSEIGEASLGNLPILSSWYADEITLTSNYYGEPSAYTRQNLHFFNMKSLDPQQYPLNATDSSDPDYFYLNSSKIDDNLNLTGGRTTFLFPIKIPYETDIDWVDENDKNWEDTKSGKAGLYVESVALTGKGLGNRSVITPINVSGENDCAVYITGRDRGQYCSSNSYFRKVTSLKNLVIRGEPYAYTGILYAPNKNVRYIELENVAIYDCYKTIAQDNWDYINNAYIWPYTYKQGVSAEVAKDGSADNNGMADNSGLQLDLIVRNCNLRGYTVPGDFRKITYIGTTFERGANTGHGELEYTCKVDKSRQGVSFENCFFKAPFIIDLTNAEIKLYKDGKNSSSKPFTFTNSKATSTKNSNLLIDLSGKKSSTKMIEIKSDSQGYPEAYYYSDAEKKILITWESANPASDHYKR